MSRLKYITTKSGCWLWSGAKNKGGYGTLTVGSRTDASRTTMLAHRYSYSIHKGSFDKKLCVLHRCDNPPCVNPNHLFLGTRLDNHTDMVGKGRRVDLRGEQRPNHKLTQRQVTHIKSLLESGTHQTVIAKKFGVNQTLVSAIKTNKVWSHV